MCCVSQLSVTRRTSEIDPRSFQIRPRRTQIAVKQRRRRRDRDRECVRRLQVAPDQRCNTSTTDGTTIVPCSDSDKLELSLGASAALPFFSYTECRTNLRR